MLNDLKDLLKYKISEVKNGQRFFIGDREYIRLSETSEKLAFEAMRKHGAPFIDGSASAGCVYLDTTTGGLSLRQKTDEVTGEGFGVPLKELKIGDYFIDSDGALCQIRGKSDSVCYIDFLGGEDTIYDLTRQVKPVEVTVEDGVITIKTEP